MTGWKGATGYVRTVSGFTVRIGTTFARGTRGFSPCSDEDEYPSTVVTVSKILFRILLFFSFFSRRIKYFCACDATCVGVRVGT